MQTSCSADADIVVFRATRRVISLLLLLRFSVKRMAKKRVAGLAVFRQNGQDVEFLMLKPSKEGKDWSPPKGASFKIYVFSNHFVTEIDHFFQVV